VLTRAVEIDMDDWASYTQQFGITPEKNMLLAPFSARDSCDLLLAMAT
jgi:hypothetical protein